jgi:hypothetical protein
MIVSTRWRVAWLSTCWPGEKRDASLFRGGEREKALAGTLPAGFIPRRLAQPAHFLDPKQSIEAFHNLMQPFP